MSENNYVNLGNARRKEQIDVMKKIVDDGVCPFCPEHLKKYHKKPILKEGDYWLLTFNQWPYENTKQHFMAIAKHHVTNFLDLNPEARAELLSLFEWAAREYGVKNGGIGMRFGGTEHTGATVNHLHAHLIEPDPNRPADKPVRFKIG